MWGVTPTIPLMIWRRHLLIFALFLSPIAGLCQDDLGKFTSRPAPEEGPTKVVIRVIMLDLDDISGANQTYTANVAYMARWQDDRLRHDSPGNKATSLSQIWHPRIQILNRQRLQETFPEQASVSPSGEVEVLQRVWGQFSQPLVLHDFPFDHQTLNFDLVAAGHEPGSLELIADPEHPSQIADTFSVSDWAVSEWGSKPVMHSLVSGDNPVPLFRMFLTMKRNSGYHLINFILPLVMIICMSWIVFWIPPSNTGPRVSVSVTSMLTLVAYRFAVGASLPKIAYLTRMDWFILGSSFLIFFALVQVVVTSWMADNDNLATARRVNKWMRCISPVALVLIFWLSLF